MHRFDDYDVIIFDCDGVLLDSNRIKIDAMKLALDGVSSIIDGKESSLEYFERNFGKSRFHHAEKFVSAFLVLKVGADPEEVVADIIRAYGDALDLLYCSCNEISGVRTLLEFLSSKRRYVASGSEEIQLRKVLSEKGLDASFDEIYGSPRSKINIVKKIILETGVDKKRVILVGDSIPDLNAAVESGIDFIGVTDFSNTPLKLSKICKINNFPVMTNLKEFFSA